MENIHAGFNPVEREVLELYGCRTKEERISYQCWPHPSVSLGWAADAEAEAGWRENISSVHKDNKAELL